MTITRLILLVMAAFVVGFTLKVVLNDYRLKAIDSWRD